MRSLLEKKILRVLALAAAFTAAFAFFAFAAEANYEHDPRRCWNTMKDVEYDPAAIYGYRPAAVKESNLKKYGNENGPTADSLYACDHGGAEAGDSAGIKSATGGERFPTCLPEDNGTERTTPDGRRRTHDMERSHRFHSFITNVP